MSVLPRTPRAGVAIQLQLTALRREDVEQLRAELEQLLGPGRVLLAPPSEDRLGTYSALGLVLLLPPTGGTP